MADQRRITLYPCHATPKTIVLRPLPVADAAPRTTIYLYAGHASATTIVLSNPRVARESGGTVIVEATATSAGVASGTGVGAALWETLASSSSPSTVAGETAAVVGGVGASNGVAVGLGDSDTILGGPPPIGTVPIRYLVGPTANVVPVVTVGAWAIGVVRCREFVGPAHVVPVREVTVEYPHVKIVKV